MRKNDKITLTVPYGTFVYRVNGDRIVPANDISVLHSPRHEVLILQACHPRFFATHRYLQYGRLLRVDPKGGQPYQLSLAAPRARATR